MPLKWNRLLISFCGGLSNSQQHEKNESLNMASMPTASKLFYQGNYYFLVLFSNLIHSSYYCTYGSSQSSQREKFKKSETKLRVSAGIYLCSPDLIKDTWQISTFCIQSRTHFLDEDMAFKLLYSLGLWDCTTEPLKYYWRSFYSALQLYRENWEAAILRRFRRPVTNNLTIKI